MLNPTLIDGWHDEPSIGLPLECTKRYAALLSIYLRDPQWPMRHLPITWPPYLHPSGRNFQTKIWPKDQHIWLYFDSEFSRNQMIPWFTIEFNWIISRAEEGWSGIQAVCNPSGRNIQTKVWPADRAHPTLLAGWIRFTCNIPLNGYKFSKNSPVALDILGAVLHVSQSFGSILNEQLLDQILGDGIHVTWPFNFTGQDLLVDTERVVVEKWRVTGQHLVDQDPCSQQKFQRPYSTQRSLPLSNANFNHFFFWFVPLGESRRESRVALHVALLWRLIKSFRSFGKEILAFLRNLEARATRPCWIFINHRSLTRVWWITCLISHSTWF